MKALTEKNLKLNTLISFKEELFSERASIVVKDNICTKDFPTTCASGMLEGFTPGYDATVVARLREAGFKIAGKTNMDEFAMGSTGETSFFGPVLNPFDETRVAGGSSGGSAALVATGLCDAALASDTGGSIRLPASYCDVVGIKPTYGRVSRYGLVSYASTFDQIGPIAKDVMTAARILNIISGFDEKDSTSAKRIDDFTKIRDIKGLRIASLNYPSDNTNPLILKSIEKSKQVFGSLGAEIIEVEWTLTREALSAYYIIACAQASSNLARFDGIRYGAKDFSELGDLKLSSRYDEAKKHFGGEVLKRISLGENVLSTGFYEDYYIRALKVRRLIAEAYDEIFKKADVILSPVSDRLPPKLFEYRESLNMYMCDVFNIGANLSGLPSMSVPSFWANNLPVGLLLTGRAWCESDMISVAKALEDNIKDKRRLG